MALRVVSSGRSYTFPGNDPSGKTGGAIPGEVMHAICPYCKKRFRVRDLSAHVALVHLGDRALRARMGAVNAVARARNKVSDSANAGAGILAKIRAAIHRHAGK